MCIRDSHVISGDRTAVMEHLSKGLIDFALLHGDVDSAQFESRPVPFQHIWGILMRKDSPLAEKEAVTEEDLYGQPMILSRQIYQSPDFQESLKNGGRSINVVATYNLLYNGSLTVSYTHLIHGLTVIPLRWWRCQLQVIVLPVKVFYFLKCHCDCLSMILRSRPLSISARAIFSRSGMIKGTTHQPSTCLLYTSNKVMLFVPS